MLVTVWKTIGYPMVIYLAGLQAIPGDFYEAAALDGAAGWQRFRHVTWPLLTPTTLFLVVTLTIASFQGFDIVKIMTQGGPVTSTMIYVYYIYEQAFQYFKLGRASAAVVVFFALILLLTLGSGSSSAAASTTPREPPESARPRADRRGARAGRRRGGGPLPLDGRTSLKDLPDVTQFPPTLIPNPPRWDNYAKAWQSGPFLRFLVNNVIQTVGILVLQLFFGCLAAYAFSKLRFPGRDLCFVLVVACLIVPPQVRFVPLYILFAQLGL